jgi:outer membrane protein assembly factor BamB
VLPLRLAAANRLVDPLGTPEMLAKNVGFFTDPMNLFAGLSAGLTERNTPERWDQVMTEYERFLRDSSDVLVPMSESLAPLSSTVPAIQVRRLAHEKLATLPPSLLEAYRRRVDGQALKLLREGQLHHDPAPLRKLVDEMFCSRFGENALDVLGDLAFEKGQFTEAMFWWSQLAAPLEAGSSVETEPWPQFPKATIDPALPRAKQILARLFLGQTGAAERDLKVFRSRHGEARGRLAGRSGVLADLLGDVLRQAKERKLFQPEPSWTSFAGGNMREHPLAEALPARLWADGPTWRRPLPGKKETHSSRKLGGHPQPAFHPLIVDDQVLLADAAAVYSFDQLTGEPLWTYDLKGAGLQVPAPLDPNHPADLAPQYTLTAHGGKVFVRLGQQAARYVGESDRGFNYIICLDLIPQPGGKRELWRVAEQRPLKEIGGTLFEGAPLVVEDRVYVALTKFAGQRTQTSIACYDAGSGRLRWIKEVCEAIEAEAPVGGEAPPRARHHLLTMAGGQLVYCSHSGSIVAVDPWSGRRLWGLRYPRRGRVLADGSLPPRGLAPCVFHDNRLYVAPQDSDTLFCLDPDSGLIVWERPGVEVVHLLGVARQRLFLQTPQGLRAVNAGTGTDDIGWQQPAVGKLPSLGRGLLMGEWVLWPTQEPVSTQNPLEPPAMTTRALCQSDGSQDGADGSYYEATQLQGLVAGNLAYAHGCLVVAGTDELAVYVDAARLLKKLAQIPLKTPADQYRWAQALAETGEKKQAAAVLTELGRHGPLWDKLARQTWADLLVVKAASFDMGRIKASSFDNGIKAGEFDNGNVKAGSIDNEALAKLLQDARLEQEFVMDDKRLPRSKADLIRSHLRSTWNKNYEELAEKELARVGIEPGPLTDFARTYSGTKAGVKALFELARMQESNQHPGDAAWAFRALLDQSLEPRQRQQAQDGLTRALAKLDSPGAIDKSSSMSLPVLRRWEVPGRGLLDSSCRSGNAAIGKADHFVVVDGKRITCRRFVDGAECWTQEIPFAAQWTETLGEVVVVAGPDGVQGMLRENGRKIWYFPSPSVVAERVQLRGDQPVVLRDGGRFAGFQLGGGKLVFCFDHRRLICLAFFTGRVAWTQWAPAGEIRPLLAGGKFEPNFTATAQRVLIQTHHGKRWLLDIGTGNRIAETDCTVGFCPPPLLVEQGRKACLSLESGTIALIDLDNGKETWRFTYPWRSSLSGEPAKLLEQDGLLWAVFPLNYGQEIQRLDLADGKALWPEAILLQGKIHGWCTGKNAKTGAPGHCCFVLDNRIQCRGLEDGKLLWHKPLPTGAQHWQLACASQALVVYPDDPIKLPRLPGAGLDHFPLLEAMKPAPTSDPAMWLFDASDGVPLQRLALTSPHLDVLLLPAGIVLADRGKIRGYTDDRSGPQ